MNKQINITKIPKNLKFEGYLWMSNSEKPLQTPTEIGAMLNQITDNDNPFIIEGQLYVKDQKSYSIKYADGKHIVIEYDLTDMPKEYTEKSFIPNRLDNVAKIKFRQYWKAKPDNLCEGMEVLVPAEYVFLGFDYSSNKVKEEK